MENAARQSSRRFGFQLGLIVLMRTYVGVFTLAQQRPIPSTDAVAEAQQPADSRGTRPEETKTEHDRSTDFDGRQAPSSPVFETQPKAGKNSGFDFFRDPLNADRPAEDPDAIMNRLIAGKPAVMQAQQALLQQRFNLEPKRDPEVKMSRGKPLAVGPTARLRNGVTWDRLAQMPVADIQQQGLFPYPSLPHPLQANGGQVFPRMQIEMFLRLERVDVDFDLPEVLLPESPPAIFLSNRPELGDVSRGEVVSVNNYYKLFKRPVNAGAAGRPPALAHAVSAERIQSVIASRVNLAWVLPAWIAAPTATRPDNSTSPPICVLKSDGSVWTPSVSVVCSINRFTVQSAVCDRSRILRSSNSAPRTLMATKSMRPRKA
jgi:hypothetical protein